MVEGGGPTALLSRVFASDLGKILKHIVQDAIVTLALLGALSVVHLASGYTGASPEFIETFTEVHQYCFLGTYLLLAVKSVIRLAKF